jgi:hypothetical protein
MAIDSAPSLAAMVRSAAASCLASAGTSSLPISRMVTLSNSIGQNGKLGRSCRVA